MFPWAYTATKSGTATEPTAAQHHPKRTPHLHPCPKRTNLFVKIHSPLPTGYSLTWVMEPNNCGHHACTTCSTRSPSRLRRSTASGHHTWTGSTSSETVSRILRRSMGCSRRRASRCPGQTTRGSRGCRRPGDRCCGPGQCRRLCSRGRRTRSRGGWRRGYVGSWWRCAGAG